MKKSSMRRSNGLRKSRGRKIDSSSDIMKSNTKRRTTRNLSSSSANTPTKSEKPKKKKVKKQTPFEKFSSKKSKKILDEYRSNREILKGRRKTQTEIEKEKQIALNQYYEIGLLRYREKKYSESYELLKRGYSSLQHAITHIFEFSEEEIEAGSSRSSSRKKNKTLNLIRGKKGRRGDGEDEAVDYQNLFAFVKKLSRDISYILCKVCYILESYEECIYFAEKTLLVDPVSTKCFQFSAFSAYKTKDYVKAAELFEKLLLVTPPPHDKNDISQYINPVSHGLQTQILDHDDEEYEKKKRKEEKKKYDSDLLYVEAIEKLTECTDKLERHDATVKYSSMLIEHYHHVLKKLKVREDELIRISNLKKQNLDQTAISEIHQGKETTNKKLAGLYYTRACSNELLGGQVHPFFHENPNIEEIDKEISEFINDNNKLELKHQKDEEKIKLARLDYSRIITHDPDFLSKFRKEAEENNSISKKQVNLFKSLKTYLVILRIERDRNLIFTYSIIVSNLFQDIKSKLLLLRHSDDEKTENIELFLLQHSVRYISHAIKLRNEVSFFPNEEFKNKVLCDLYLQRGKFYSRILSLQEQQEEKELKELKKNILLDFSISMEHSPDNSECFKSRGMFFLSQNRVYEAKDDFENFVQLFSQQQQLLQKTKQKKKNKLEFANYNFFEEKKMMKVDDSHSLIYNFLFDLYYYGDQHQHDEQKQVMDEYDYENTNFEKCVGIVSKILKDPNCLNTFSSSLSSFFQTKEEEENDMIDRIIFCFCKYYDSITQQQRLEATIIQQEKEQQEKEKEEQQEEGEEESRKRKVSSKTTPRKKSKVVIRTEEEEKKKKKIGVVPSLFHLGLCEMYAPLERVNGPFLKQRHDFRKCFRSILLEYNLERGIGNDLVNFSLGGDPHLQKSSSSSMSVGMGGESSSSITTRKGGKRKKKK